MKVSVKHIPSKCAIYTLVQADEAKLHIHCSNNQLQSVPGNQRHFL